MANGYSLKQGSGVISHPIAGTYTIQGQMGLGTITFTRETTRATMETSADGYVLTSFQSGNSGKCTIELKQTSSLHQYLIGMANDIDTGIDNGDLTNALAALLTYKAPTGSVYTCSGVTIEKQADENYKAQGQDVTWSLLVATLIKE